MGKQEIIGKTVDQPCLACPWRAVQEDVASALRNVH